MVNLIVLCTTLLIFLLVLSVVGRAIIQKQQIMGRPPIPVVFFLLAKIMVVINLSFLLIRGVNISLGEIYRPALISDVIALVFLVSGTVILYVSTFQLNKNLIFGLSDSGDHHLVTKGLFSFSRHPFYLGFIFILLSSCLLTPNFINIIGFITAWTIHHFIMIKEEQFLESVYGEEYRLYKKRVRRYLNF
jgi:protein-S-isoprenylcysteine O-methyltransferase Ste14